MRAVVIVVAVILLGCLLQSLPVEARKITGNVSINADTSQLDSIELIEAVPKLDASIGHDEKLELPVKPDWIEGNVFSNDDMLMYSFFQIPPFKKEFRWKIPNRRSCTIDLRPSVVRHWKGWKPKGKCRITCVPLGSGRFRFYHRYPEGPHGYLERVGKNKKGFHQYRFWFDES